MRRDIFGLKRPRKSAANAAIAAPAFETPLGSALPNNFPSPDQHLAEAVSRDNRKPRIIRVIQGLAQGDYLMLDDVNSAFEIVIGRSESATITLPDASVSGQHARIFEHGGDYYIEDLHSTNGTLINSRKISSPTKLEIGSQIRIGKNILELEG